MKKLMTGNEAIARGAWEAGVKYASAYPGTPSTEILENAALYKDDILAEWAPNEKVALEAAIGGCIAGARTFAAMKHVGLNVAADPLFTFSYTGVNGGMVIITADEPGQHSSQNEQDNRNYAKAAKLAMFEPSDSQEAKDMMVAAYDVSEEFDVPVLFRMTTRVCHSKSVVQVSERNEVGIKPYVKDVNKYLTVPAISRVLRVKVEDRMNKLKAFSNSCKFNYIEDNGSKVGVIASGGAYIYAREVFGNSVNYLKIGFSYPQPDELITKFCSSVELVYVLEENDPFIEDEVRRLGFDCRGNDFFPPYGELTPDVIRKAVYGKTLESVDYDKSLAVPRPPALCAGCPHRGFFYELGKRKDVMVSGDIGCYTLGFAEPYNAMDTTVVMGGSMSIGHGAQQVFNMEGATKKRVVSVLGDSTFFHTGMNSLLDVVYNGSNSINVILDNRITGMTGHQENPGSGYTLQGKPTVEVSIEAVVRSFGIKNVVTVNPNNLKEMREAFDKAFASDEMWVIITRYPCALKKFSAEDRKEFEGAFASKCVVDEDKCIGCKLCTKTGCPAISFDKNRKKSMIDKAMCVGCSVCAQVCPKQAIVKGGM